MTTATAIMLILSGMFVGSTIAFAFMFMVLLKSEKHLELQVAAVELAYKNGISLDDARHVLHNL